MEIPISKPEHKVIIRSGPRKSKTQVNALIAEDSKASALCHNAVNRDAETGNDHAYSKAVFAYLQVHAAYLSRGKEKPLITDLDQILKGVKAAQTLDPVRDVRILRIVDTNYNGSFDDMLKDFESNHRTRPAYRMADKAPVERERIRELKEIQEKEGINLADYCVVP